MLSSSLPEPLLPFPHSLHLVPPSVMSDLVLVTGAGGFIGHHLVSYLKAKGYRVRGADQKLPEY